jgi:hypothetical protein
MNIDKFDLQKMQSLLRLRADDPAVIELIGHDLAVIQRDAYLGWVEFKDEGISLMFAEAPWVLPAHEIRDAKALHVSAFHLHRAGHEGYSQYCRQLPNGVALDDSEGELLRKLGQPMATGGGGMSRLLKKPIPRWLKYSLGDAILHFQLDPNNHVEMITLSTPDVRPSAS